MLSNKVPYPSLYHMAPKDDSLPQAMGQLILYFGWVWMGLAASDDMRGEQFLSAWREERSRKGSVLPFQRLSLWVRDAVKRHLIIWPSIDGSTRTYSYSGYHSGTYRFPGDCEIFTAPYARIEKVWIICPPWDVALTPTFQNGYGFHGTLLFSHQKGAMPEFGAFLRTVHSSKYPENIFPEVFLVHSSWVFRGGGPNGGIRMLPKCCFGRDSPPVFWSDHVCG